MEQTVEFITLLLTGLAAGIGFYQFTGGTPAYRGVSARTFVEYHKKLDSYMTVRMPPFFLLGQVFILIWLLLERQNWQSFTFMMLVLAFISTTIELVTIFRGNRPINFIIQTWSLEGIPDDWAEYRDKWLSFFNIRIATASFTFLFLLAAIIWGKS